MDHELEFIDDLQDISDSIAKAVKAAAAGDRIVMSKEQAETMLQSFNELWDDVAAHDNAAAARKPLFLHVKTNSQDAYLQPATIAIVAVDHQGNAVLNMVNGSNLVIEALQWQIMKKYFHEGVDLVEVPSTGGLVKA